MNQSKIVQQTEFSSRLRSALEASGLSQQALARRISTSQGTIQGWLNGSMPRKRIQSELATALNVNAHWLITGEGSLQSFARKPLETLEQVLGARETRPPDVIRKDPPAYHSAPDNSRLAIALARIREDISAMAQATPSQRRQLAEQAKLHIDHYALWLDAAEAD